MMTKIIYKGSAKFFEKVFEWDKELLIKTKRNILNNVYPISTVEQTKLINEKLNSN